MAKKTKVEETENDDEQHAWWKTSIKAIGIEAPIMIFFGIIFGIILSVIFMSVNPDLFTTPLIANAVRATVSAQTIEEKVTQTPISTDTDISRLPLRIVDNFDFDEKDDPTKIWKPSPDDQSHQFLLSSEHAHSGKSSLQAIVNIQSLKTGENEYVGISISQSDLPALQTEQIVACVAWIFIPTEDIEQDNNLYAHIIGEVYEDDGSYMGVFSEDVKIVPGKWTPIFWGATYTTVFDNFSFESTNRELNNLFINVWDSDNPYKGSVFFDDIVLYAYAE